MPRARAAWRDAQDAERRMEWPVRTSVPQSGANSNS